MDPAEDRVIEVGNPICDKEHSTIAIFQFAKEHRDQLVASDIRLRALFQIHVCFVQNNQGVLVVGGLEHARELNFHHR